MGNISGIIENVKDNIKYFINSDDTFEVVIEKIIKKFRTHMRQFDLLM